MENKTNHSTLLEQLDMYSIVRDVVRNLWLILLGALAAAMLTNVAAHLSVENTYTTSATFVVTSKTSGNYVYSNLSAASTAANSLSNLLNSNLLKKRVCQDLGVADFDATMTASVISDTNLMTLDVTADTPQNAYRIIRSIMKNVDGLTGYVSNDMVMEVLQEPPVPTGADTVFSARREAKRAFAVAALALTAAFMYLSYRKETIKSEKDLEEKLDARSLGMVYSDDSNLFRTLQRKEKNNLLVTELTAKFEFVEHYKKIAAHVATQAKKNGAKVILVTSVQEHEGKSTVSANLALSLAQQSREVLLIDGDMRRPTLNHMFLEEGEKLPHTLGDLLQEKTIMGKALRYDEKRNVYLLLNQLNYNNSTDIVSSENMTRLLEVARKVFDYIIIDSPPMSLMADAEVLADRADMSVLVVKYDMILAEDLNDAIDSLRDCKAHFAGCILNQVCTLPGARRTVAGYGAYGRYGQYGRYDKYGRYGHYGNYGERAK
jgi:capsular exopolysaccharide synthesis family protein